jgi:hypothetical protein
MSQAITLREFWKREGFTKPQALYLAEHGLIEGATLNPYSKKWSIKEPAKLVGWLAALSRPTERQPIRASASSADGVMVAAVCNHADTHPSQVVAIPAMPSLADGFGVAATGSHAQQSEHGGQAAMVQPEIYHDPQGQSEDFFEEPQGDESVLVFNRPKVRQACYCLRKAVAKQERNLHRLRLDSSELVHLFHAVDSARSRARQAAGKGLTKVGSLRATDSLWHKLQAAMQRCHLRRHA